MNCKKKNRIAWIKKADGIVTYKEWEIVVGSINYFANLFHSSGPMDLLPNIVTRPAQISDEENQNLIAIPFIEEIRKITASLNGLKAPRADGFSTHFFRKN